jgi:hypothetical protein
LRGLYRITKGYFLVIPLAGSAAARRGDMTLSHSASVSVVATIGYSRVFIIVKLSAYHASGWFILPV